MGTKTYNNYQNLITFSRASAGYALRPVSYGDELVVNGGFDSDSDWTKGDGWSISDGKARSDGSQTAVSNLDQSLPQLSAGKVYEITHRISDRSAGGLQVLVGGITLGYNYADGFYRESVLTTTTGGIFLQATSNFVGSVDSVSVKEVLFDQSGGRLTLFEHPNNVPRIEYALNDSKDRFENIDDEILKAVVGQEPQATEFDVLVNGRKIGDITNNGDVSAFDASQYANWLVGTLTNQTYIDYIEDVLNPYIEANLDKYILPYPEGVDRLGLLIEEARTNLITYSEDFSQWTNTRSSDDADSATAPDGTETATSFYMDNTAASTHIIKKSATVVASSTNTFSVFVKPNSLNFVRLLLSDTSVNDYFEAFFNVSTGEVGTTDSGASGTFTSATIQNAGSGWYRCAITGIVSSDTSVEARIYLAEADNDATIDGDGTSGIYIWGAQLEAGSFPTSYIKSNSGSTTTRSADVASIPVADFGYNKGEGTALVECTLQEQDVSNLRILGGTASTRWLYANSPDDDYPIVFYDGVNTPAIATNVTSLTIKAAISVEVDSAVGSVNGSTPIPRTHNGNLLGITSFEIFGNNTGHIKAIKYYPRSLTEAQLQDLTS